MSKFDLNNFKNKTDIDRCKDLTTPSWYENLTNTQKQIYQTTVKHYLKIKTSMTSAKSLSIKDRKIILSEIAREVNVDRSYITKRRMPEIISFVNECNDKLNRCWQGLNKKQSSKNLSKKELEREVSRLKKLLSKEKDKNISDYINNALDNGFNKTHKSLLLELSELKAQNSQYIQTIANLRLQLKNRLHKLGK